MTSRLQRVLDVAGSDLAGEPLDAGVALRARDLIAAVAAFGETRELVVRFTRSYDAGWHLDLAIGGEWIAAQWLASGGDEGCFARIRIAPGGRLDARLNSETAVHWKERSGAGPCVRGSSTPFRLDAPSGEIDLSGLRVHWDVVEGWPAWPPVAAS